MKMSTHRLSKLSSEIRPIPTIQDKAIKMKKTIVKKKMIKQKFSSDNQ